MLYRRIPIRKFRYAGWTATYEAGGFWARRDELRVDAVALELLRLRDGADARCAGREDRLLLARAREVLLLLGAEARCGGREERLLVARLLELLRLRLGAVARCGGREERLLVARLLELLRLRLGAVARCGGREERLLVARLLELLQLRLGAVARCGGREERLLVARLLELLRLRLGAVARCGGREERLLVARLLELLRLRLGAVVRCGGREERLLVARLLELLRLRLGAVARCGGREERLLVARLLELLRLRLGAVARCGGREERLLVARLLELLWLRLGAVARCGGREERDLEDEALDRDGGDAAGARRVELDDRVLAGGRELRDELLEVAGALRGDGLRETAPREEVPREDAPRAVVVRGGVLRLLRVLRALLLEEVAGGRVAVSRLDRVELDGLARVAPLELPDRLPAPSITLRAGDDDRLTPRLPELEVPEDRVVLRVAGVLSRRTAPRELPVAPRVALGWSERRTEPRLVEPCVDSPDLVARVLTPAAPLPLRLALEVAVLPRETPLADVPSTERLLLVVSPRRALVALVLPPLRTVEVEPSTPLLRASTRSLRRAR